MGLMGSFAIFVALSLLSNSLGFSFFSHITRVHAPTSSSRCLGALGLRMSSHDELVVMVNGMPGPMATEVAKVCIDRGITLTSVAFTGPGSPESILVEGRSTSQKVSLIQGPGINDDAKNILSELVKSHPRLVVVDYTHPSAVLSNIGCYCACDANFVMGTTGGDPSEMKKIFDTGKNKAVIAPNMAKQIVALQAALEAMTKRFPSSFLGYQLKVTESHQSTKADTSGTAKAVVQHLVDLNGGDFDKAFESIEKVRDPVGQLAFGVPEGALKVLPMYDSSPESPASPTYMLPDDVLAFAFSSRISSFPHAYTYTHTHIHACIHTYIHTYKQT
jgi:4-hydroxy-tetrahydrodipicolinate reductase